MVLREWLHKKVIFNWKYHYPLADRAGKILSTFLRVNSFSLKHPARDLSLDNAIGNELTTLFERQYAGSLIKTGVSLVSYVPAQQNGVDRSFACLQSKGIVLRAEVPLLGWI